LADKYFSDTDLTGLTATAAVETGTTVRIAVTAEDRPGSTDTAEGEKAL